MLLNIRKTLALVKTHQLRECAQILKNEGYSLLPLGEDNSKTDLPGFYRPVGKTCPRTCVHKPFCYALEGYVRLASIRATPNNEACVNSFILCGLYSLTRYYSPCRLFISGDLASKGKLDTELCKALCEASQGIRKALKQPGAIVGYGYSHCKDAPAQEFSNSGIEMLLSDQPLPGGALVGRFQDYEKLKLKYPSLTLVKCRSQLNKPTTCRNCTLCWQARKNGWTILFAPHGKRKYKLEKFLEEKYFS